MTGVGPDGRSYGLDGWEPEPPEDPYPRATKIQTGNDEAVHVQARSAPCPPDKCPGLEYHIHGLRLLLQTQPASRRTLRNLSWHADEIARLTGYTDLDSYISLLSGRGTK